MHADAVVRAAPAQGPLAALSAHLGNPFGNNIVKVGRWAGLVIDCDCASLVRPCAVRVWPGPCGRD
jgi:hypothetical protein